MGWNRNENYSKVLQRFYIQLFGGASPYIKEYFEKIDLNFSGEADLPYLLELLSKAANSSKDAAAQKRISVLKSYLHYLALYYQQKRNPGDQQLLEELFQYILQIYPSGVIHSTYLAELLQRQMGEALLSKWSIYLPTGSKVSQIQFLSDQQVESNFLTDRRLYPLLEGFNYSARPKALRYSLKDPMDIKNKKPDGMMILELPQTLVQSSKKGVVTLMLKVNEESRNNDHQKIALQLIDTADNKEIVNKEINLDKNWETIELNVPPNKAYRLEIKNTNWIRLSVPNDQWLAFRNIPMYAVLGKLWFYNDSDQYLYFSNKNREQPVFYSNSSKALEIEKVNGQDLFRISLNKKSWFQIEAAEYKSLQFYIPNLLFFPHPNITVEHY
jgi:hypothetical protein